MVRIKGCDINRARQVAKWLSENITPGNYETANFSVSMEETLHWLSYNEHHWEVKFNLFEKTITVIGLSQEEELLLLLCFA